MNYPQVIHRLWIVLCKFRVKIEYVDNLKKKFFVSKKCSKSFILLDIFGFILYNHNAIFKDSLHKFIRKFRYLLYIKV